ncbi:origin recognition complex subunit 2 [Auriculariales sp. MPI-PUGE-AT-0066]|nr:origin recognition complex subunit 2 [Auriculariales sp. MPI-PUGE-AT-0066]
MSDNESVASSASSRSSIHPSAGKAFAHASAFDAFFAATITPAKTGDAVFSSLTPLEPEEYQEYVKRAILPEPLDATPFYGAYATTIDAGFNIFFYGYGSKLSMLDKFARKVLCGRGPVVVSRCFSPSFDLKLFLSILQRATDAAAATIESALSSLDSAPRTIIFLMHSLDKAPPKVRAAALRLAAHPKAQVVASLDHVRASSLFTQRDLAGWAWHDLTTLAPYDTELAHIDPLALRQTRDGGSGTTANAGQRITESGAIHVLASVTPRAKQLFTFLARRQLDTEDGDDDSARRNAEPDSGIGIEWDALLSASRTNFIAINDVSLRALLVEFTDHGLVRVENDAYWIPLRKDVLTRVLDKAGLQ